MVLVISIFTLSNYLVIQIALFVLVNLLYLVYLLNKKVIFEGYRIEIFNEVCNLVCSIMLFIFTDFVDDNKLKYQIGFCFIGIYILNFLVNLVIILIESFKSIILRLKVYCLKLKYMKLFKNSVVKMMRNKGKKIKIFNQPGVKKQNLSVIEEQENEEKIDENT